MVRGWVADPLPSAQAEGALEVHDVHREQQVEEGRRGKAEVRVPDEVKGETSHLRVRDPSTPYAGRLVWGLNQKTSTKEVHQRRC